MSARQMVLMACPWGRVHDPHGMADWLVTSSWTPETFSHVPEDAHKQLQGGLLYLAVEFLLPGPPVGLGLVQVCAGEEVGGMQLVVELEALHPGRRQTEAGSAPAPGPRPPTSGTRPAR